MLIGDHELEGCDGSHASLPSGKIFRWKAVMAHQPLWVKEKPIEHERSPPPFQAFARAQELYCRSGTTQDRCTGSGHAPTNTVSIVTGLTCRIAPYFPKISYISSADILKGRFLSTNMAHNQDPTRNGLETETCHEKGLSPLGHSS